MINQFFCVIFGFLYYSQFAFAQTTEIESSDCSCDVYSNILKTSCEVLEKNFDLDCSNCVCDNNFQNQTLATNENSPPAVLYVSLVANGLLAIAAFVSELLGSNDKISVNGVLHAFMVACGKKKPNKKDPNKKSSETSESNFENKV